MRDDYLHSIVLLDQSRSSKAAEFLSLTKDKQWLWILGAGCYPAAPPRKMYDHSTSPVTSIFHKGKCYEIDKKNDTVLDVIASFEKFQAIVNEIPRSHYHIYTDGSRDTVSKHSGAAAVIYHRGHIIGSCEEYTGKESVNYAELHAILLGLRWIRDRMANSRRNHFHFWVDSEYAFKLLTEQQLAKKHFFTAQEILQLTSYLHYSCQHSFTIHRISSHVERHSAGACKIEGSIEVDRRAQHASTQEARFTSIEKVRMQILDRTAQLLRNISGLVYKNTAGPSDSSDDFSVPATADQGSNRSSVLQSARVSAHKR